MSIFDRLKLKNKIILIIIIQTTLLIVFGIIGFNISFSVYQKQILGQMSQIMNLLADNVDTKLKRIDNMTFEIATDDDLQSSLIKLDNDVPSYQNLQNATVLRSKLLHSAFTEEYVDSIGVIDLRNSQYFEGTNSSLLDFEQINQINESTKGNAGSIVWIRPANNNDEILAVRKIKRINDFSLSNLGMLVLKINKQRLIQSRFDYLAKTNYYFGVFSNNEIILEDINNVKLNPFDFNIHDKEGYSFKTINKKNYFINYSTFDYTGWQFAFALPIQNILLQISNIQIIVVLLYLVVFAFTTYFGIKFSIIILKPLDKLMTTLKTMKNQWFNNSDYSDYLNSINFSYNKDKDEIRFIERDFKLLVDRINSLLKENYDEKIMKKEWQLKALQRQINPHFLYNTLDSVYWLSKINNQDQICIIIKSLGNLLRNSIYKSENIITLSEEIGILNDYINIQKFRFQDRLKINIDISEEFLMHKIPNLSIQTIVENSISHGLEVKTDDCLIDITASFEGEDIQITILDNGPGVDSEMLEKLQNMKIEPHTSGIGLKNIDERIKIIFGNQYGLCIESEQSKWFKVTICIPKTKEV